ncbi:MAG: hypothetical protein H0V23_06935 [Nocardioidaceae bacterium]|nr:hypothetical protein [Nocardioidaceae bacterium]
MAPRTPDIYLHIGPMKSGTSYLQQLMADNQAALRADGVLFPGRNPRSDQGRAVRDILTSGRDGDQQRALAGSWAKLREEMLRFDGRACVVSMEFLSFARGKLARQIVASLAPARVHIVLTLRDSARVLPSSWATQTRNTKTASWQEFTDAVLGNRRRNRRQWRRSMRALNVPRMLKDWGELVPSERLHVVVVPPSGAAHGLLWERFASVIGVDPGGYEPAPGRRNESFGYVSADLMRRVNAQLVDLPPGTYHRAVRYLVKEVLDRRTGEPQVPMTRRLNRFARRWNRTMVDAVISSGAQVYGDLDDLRVVPGVTVDKIEPPSDDALLAAAADALTGMNQDGEKFSPSRWAEASDPVGAAVREVADAVRRAIDLQEPVESYRTRGGRS